MQLMEQNNNENKHTRILALPNVNTLTCVKKVDVKILGLPTLNVSKAAVKSIIIVSLFFCSALICNFFRL